MWTLMAIRLSIVGCEIMHLEFETFQMSSIHSLNLPMRHTNEHCTSGRRTDTPVVKS
jgi:hypothetical protein